MGYRLASVTTTTVIASPALAAETIIATTGPLNPPLDNTTALIFWYLMVTIGTTGNGAIVRLRRGTLLTSPQVNNPFTNTAVAGNTITLSGSFPDNPGPASGVQYTLTLAIPAATAASIVGELSLIAMFL